MICLRPRTIIMLVAITALAALPGCSRPDKTDATSKAKQTLTIKGSDTMVHLMSTWAESFGATSRTQVSVTGGGSGTGIAALLNGTTDICAASRQIEDKETALAKQKNITPNEITVALDGIAVVVHPDNPITELSLEQIGAIYTGAIGNWKEVGGPDQPILLLSRESSSGTYVFFQEKVLNKKDYSQQARLMPGTSAVVQAVTADRGAIGYVGLGYAKEAGNKVKTIAVRSAAGQPAVMPSPATVKDASYPVARALYLYTNGAPQGKVKEFVDFCLGSAGQKIVADTGYVQVH